MVTITDIVGLTLLALVLSGAIIPAIFIFIYTIIEKQHFEFLTRKRHRTLIAFFWLASIAGIGFSTISTCKHMIKSHKHSVHEMNTETIIAYNDHVPELTTVINRSNKIIRYYHESSFDGNKATYTFIDVAPSGSEVLMDHYNVDNVLSESPIDDHFVGTKVVEDISGLHIWNKGNDTIIAKNFDEQEIARSTPSVFSEWKREISHDKH